MDKGTSPATLDEASHDRLLRHVAEASGGVPAKVRGILEEVGKEQEITPAKALQYVEMSSAGIVVLVIGNADRTVSLGLGDERMLVHFVLATAIFMGLWFFFQMRSRR